jgi:enamine deaminase RidA (YjgF/YER057c/UK114 family)
MRNHVIRNNMVDGVRSGNLIAIRGQTGRGGDMTTQIASSLDRIGQVLDELGAGLADLTKLLVAFDGATGLTDRQVLDLVARALPAGVVTTATAVPRLYLRHPDTLVEIEAVALAGLPRRAVVHEGLVPLPDGLAHGLQAGELIWLSGLNAADRDGQPRHAGDIVAQSHMVMDGLGEVLARFGADFDDVVKQHRWGSGTPTHTAWAPAALACADRYTEPGPVATGIAVPLHYAGGMLIKVEFTAMRGLDGGRLARRHVWPEGHWDWPIHLPYKHGLRCGDMIFIGGQVSLDPRAEVIAPRDMQVQTVNTMNNIREVLEQLDAGMGHAMLVTDFYEGANDPADTARNAAACAGAFAAPGPAITMISSTFRGYDGMMTEIEVMARVD